MQTLEEKRDGYAVELKELERQHAEAAQAKENAEKTLIALRAEHGDKLSRFKEVQEIIALQESNNPECSVDNQPNA
tara:strand:- start:572 stop:799 length:228 start_codon:yes stop_codon:yes gene_type:complete